MIKTATGRRLSAGLVALLGFGLVACGPSTTRYPIGNDNAKQTKNPYAGLRETRGSIFGEGGLATEFSLSSLFGGGDEEVEDVTPAPGAIRVNGPLWSAALDAVSFMPLESADPQGGIIQTGWFVDPEQPDQRFRVNVFILSGELRPDGVRVAVFRQMRNEGGEWRNTPPREGTARDLEDVIVERARELSVASQFR